MEEHHELCMTKEAWFDLVAGILGKATIARYRFLQGQQNDS